MTYNNNNNTIHCGANHEDINRSNFVSFSTIFYLVFEAPLYCNTCKESIAAFCNSKEGGRLGKFR